MQTDEILDLVDENDIVVASRPRSEIYAENLHNFRVINAFLVNGNGEIWTPRRTAHKRIFPLALDMSVGGHVESGETYDEAFARETLKNSGSILQKCRGGFLPTSRRRRAAFARASS
jgi:isopentenyl-diphosphate delta-isomerase